MAEKFSLPYVIPPINLLPNAADAAGRASSYVSLRNCLKAWIVCEVNQGNAATVQFTPLQAKDSSGTGSKAIGGADTTAPIWLNDDTSTATGSDALVAQAAALNFTTDATTKNKIVVFELTPEAILDIANGFNHIAIQTGASNAANITGARLHILGSYQGQTPPTSYV
jgi:hypothetical protein